MNIKINKEVIASKHTNDKGNYTSIDIVLHNVNKPTLSVTKVGGDTNVYTLQGTIYKNKKAINVHLKLFTAEKLINIKY